MNNTMMNLMIRLMRVRRLFGFGRDQFDCEEVRSYSSDYLDDDLPPSIRERFHRHVEGCKRCNPFVATLRATVLTLRDLPRHRASSDLRNRLQECLENERSGQTPTAEQPPSTS